MTESTSQAFLPAKTVSLPSGRTVVLRSIDPAKAAALVPPELLQLEDQAAVKSLVISKALAEPELLASLIKFLLSEGVESPRIVAKASVDDLQPGEIRFQDVGSDLLPLLEAVGAYNKQTDLLSLLGPR
jgi:hypothetical protein